MKDCKKISGFTIIDLLLAIVLSVFLVGIVTVLTLQIYQNQENEEKWKTLNENSLAVSGILTSKIHSLAYKKYQIVSYHDIDKKPGSDGITVEYVDPDTCTLVRDMQKLDVLWVNHGKRFQLNDKLWISDGITNEFASIKAVEFSREADKIILNKPLLKNYQKFSEVSRYQKESYFIGQTKRLDAKHQPIDALYMKNISGKKIELVEGISQMKIEYSVENNNIINEVSGVDINSFMTIVGVAFTITHHALSKEQYFYVSLR